jgi:anti-sigma-K factor RskA
MSELDYTEALAAEYVLGTLDFEERMQARTLLDADEAFAAKVELWEHRFGELHLMVEPVEPEAAIWARIKAKVPEARQKMQPPAPEVPPPALAPTTSEPPSLDAIEAAISQAATTLTSEANSARATEPAPAPMPEGNQMPASEATPAPASEATPAPASEATPVPALEVTAAPASEATPAPALEVMAAPDSEATSAPASEATPVPALEVTAAPASEATPAPASEATSLPIPEVAAAPRPDATPARTPAVEPISPAPVVPPAAAALEAPSETRIPVIAPATAAVHRRMRRWRAFAILMTLVVAAVAALLAAWMFAPDRVPPMLQPVELMRQIGVPLPSAAAPRRPAPPESQFDE